MKREKKFLNLQTEVVQNQEYGLQKNTTTRRVAFCGVGRNFLHRQVKGRYRWRGWVTSKTEQRGSKQKGLKPVDLKYKTNPRDGSSMEQGVSNIIQTTVDQHDDSDTSLFFSSLRIDATR